MGRHERKRNSPLPSDRRGQEDILLVEPGEAERVAPGRDEPTRPAGHVYAADVRDRPPPDGVVRG